MLRLGIVGLILIGSTGALRAERQPAAPPAELVQYVRDASKLGLKDSQIQENAVKAGWPATAVNDAISHVRAASAPSQPTPAAAEETKPQPPVTNATLPEKTPDRQPPPSPSPVEQRRSTADDYIIGAGDVLQISVWKEPDASVPHAVVRPDGKIGLPLLKEIEVVGLTPKETAKLITDGLAKLIPAADVTVVVTGINSKKIYIVGAVKKEGPIPYTYQMTVMQAISEAGGLNDYAKRKKIYILRTQNGKDYRLPFDYEAVLRGERMELNIPLVANDTLVVPH